MKILTSEAKFIAMTRNKCVWQFRVPFTKFTVKLYKRVLTRAAKNLDLSVGLKMGEVGELYGVSFFTSNKKKK